MIELFVRKFCYLAALSVAATYDYSKETNYFRRTKLLLKCDFSGSSLLEVCYKSLHSHSDPATFSHLHLSSLESGSLIAAVFSLG